MNEVHAYPVAVIDALQAVLDYLWDDEAADYQARSSLEKRDHIFRQLKTLQAWLLASKKALDIAYHTVAHRCEQSPPFRSQLLTSLYLSAFTRILCAFARALRLKGRTTPVGTNVENDRGST